MVSEQSDGVMRVARYQESLPKGQVRCLLCPHECVIRDGGCGICRVRVNKQGTLYTKAYNSICSVAVDPMEKKPLFHFYPGTKIFSLAIASCNFRCLNCQNWEIAQGSPSDLQRVEWTPWQAVQEALQYHTGSMAFTYTEPTVFYEYVLDTSVLAVEAGLKTVLISNGYMNEAPLLELIPYLNAANIDLKCFDEETYLLLTGGRLHPVLETLKTLKKSDVWLEITSLIVPGYSDKMEQIREMCMWLVKNGFADTPLHFNRFFPAYKLSCVAPTSEDVLFQARKTAIDAGMSYVYIGNLRSAEGEHTVCPHCKRTIVKRTGFTVEQYAIRHNRCSFCNSPIAGVWNG